MNIHTLINKRQQIANVSLKKGDFVPYSSSNANTNYTFDLSYYGNISEVGEDPENSTIRRDGLLEIVYDILQ